MADSINNLNAVTAAATGPWVAIPVGGVIGYHGISTGTLAGTLVIQGAIDCDNPFTLATPSTQPTSGGTDHAEGWSDNYARFARLKLSSVSGTGTFTGSIVSG